MSSTTTSGVRRLTAAVRERSPGKVRHLSRGLLVAWGMLTARWRLRPDFLVVGAQRAGTTTLYRLLSAHPGVVRPTASKGIGYFDLRYARGLRWYVAHFPLRWKAKDREGRRRLAFESSGYYLFHPLAAGRIARDLPDVRVVVAVRDPVQRAYSAWKHERARGFEDEEFEKALALEGERLAGEEARFAADPLHRSFSHRHHAYLGRSQYSEQIQRYVDALGPDRVHVFDADRFFTEPAAEFAALQEWLGLPVQPTEEVEKLNARPGPSLDDELEARLRAHFAPYDAELARLMGRRPSWVPAEDDPAEPGTSGQP